MKRKILLILNLFWLLAVLVVVVVLVGKIGSFLGLFEGFPKGLDVYAYLFRIKYVSSYFPNIFWNPLWNSGVPTFTWSYPPLLAILGTALHKILGLSIELSLTSIAFIGMVLLGMGVYGIVYEATRTRTWGIFTMAILFSIGGIWGWWADGGNYPRVLAIGFWALFVFLLASYLRTRSGGKQNKWLWLGTILGLHFCLTTHLLTGVLALAVGGWLILVLAQKDRLKEILRVLGVGFLTAFYWYGPLFLTGHQAGSFLGGGVNQGAIPFRDFLDLNLKQPFYSWPKGLAFLVAAGAGLSLLSLLISFLLPRLKTLRRAGEIGFILALILGGLVFYEIANTFSWYPDKLFINGLPALSAFFLTSLFAILVAGVGIGSLLAAIPFGWARELIGVLLLLSLLPFWPIAQESLAATKKLVFNVGDEATYGKKLEDLSLQPSFRKLLLGRKREPNYRFGTDTAYVSDWWNWEYIDYPQTKDYFAQGVTYPHWQFWMENQIWKDLDNYEETNFLLDWYGIKNFAVGIPRAKTKKFLAREEDYKKLVCSEIAREDACEFEFSQARPILASTNQPVVLVIGEPESYETVFRTWAKTGLGSRSLIWLKGPKSVEKLRSSDLGGISAVFLYGYQNSPLMVEKKLKKFVEEGGGLIIEANRDQEDEGKLPDPFPVVEVDKSLISEEWELRGGDSELGQEIGWQNFSPPDYEGGGWGVALVQETKSWAQTVAYAQGKNLIVAGKLGKGRVVWSGMNLPFHLLTYKNDEEKVFLQKAVLWVLQEEESQETSFKANFVNPHKFSISVDSPARGVLFKESYVSGWKAKAGRNKVKIWRAGPDLMYVSLAKVKSFPATVEFTYHLFLFEKIAFLISLLTLVGIIDYLFGGRILKKLTSRIQSSTLLKEEEY